MLSAHIDLQDTTFYVCIGVNNIVTSDPNENVSIVLL